jgi:hypothetical protein
MSERVETLRPARWLPVIALLITVGLALGLPAWVLRQTISDGTTVAIGGQELDGQSISLHLPGLDGFAVRPAGAPPAGQSRLILHLRPAGAPDGPDLATASTQGSAAWDGTWLRFSFPALQSPYPDQVLVLIESPDAPLFLQATRQDYYPDGASTSGGDWVFEARFGGSPLARLAALPGRLAEDKPGLLGWSWLYPSLLLALVISAVGAGASLYRSVSGRMPPHTPESPSRAPDILQHPRSADADGVSPIDQADSMPTKGSGPAD